MSTHYDGHQWENQNYGFVLIVRHEIGQQYYPNKIC